MDESIKKIKNAQGLRALEQIRLAYSREILMHLSEDPTLVDELIQDLEVSTDELFNKLSGVEKGNITFYDQGLSSVLVLSKEREYQKSDKTR